MKDLSIPVSIIPKIGPKYEKLLNTLEIYTLEDLLHHYPFRYEDLSKVSTISELKENEIATTELTVISINNIFTKNRKKLTKAKAIDETGTIELVWFNQHYITNSIQLDRRYYFSGKVGSFNNSLTLISPSFELINENSLNTARIVPVYRETQGLSSKWLRSKIDFILKTILELEPIAETLPKEILHQENLLDLNDALKLVHFPESLNDIEASRKRLAFEELLLELLKIEDRKHQWSEEFEGIHLDFESFKTEIDQLISSLPFTLTNGQNDVLNEIYKDLTVSKPMNRLLEGDVGSGKTIVALIAAYINYLNGYKTLYMAPTEILATQHFETFKQYLQNKEINIALHTGSTKTKINDFQNSIIIGTHALLFSKEDIENVGLIIIDEQHRFGVEQRAKLLDLGTKDKKPNLLSMTATPIPRTLALTLYGDMELSILDTVPNLNKKITTKVIPDKLRNKTFSWINSHNEQTFIVCPLIEDSDSESFENVKSAETEFNKLKSGIFKNKNVGLMHGRMKAAEKQQVMKDFKNKKYDVLVSTPVIEVGVDIPEAAVIVLESAERYGLASLHQLRGRVGRGSKEGYCFLFMSNYSKNSYARLKNLENESSGIKLAEIDMKYRGQGDLFGTMQHGFKSFKIAELSDLELIEKTKYWAKKIYPEIRKYKTLNTEFKKSYNIQNN